MQEPLRGAAGQGAARAEQPEPGPGFVLDPVIITGFGRVRSGVGVAVRPAAGTVARPQQVAPPFRGDPFRAVGMDHPVLPSPPAERRGRAQDARGQGIDRFRLGQQMDGARGRGGSR